MHTNTVLKPSMGIVIKMDNLTEVKIKKYGDKKRKSEELNIIKNK